MFDKTIDELTLIDVIQYLNFEECQGEVVEKCADYIVFGFANFSNFKSIAYEWCLDEKSVKFQKLKYLVYDVLGVNFERLHLHPQIDDRTPIICENQPKEFKNKKDFLSKHQQYRETNSFDDCKIFFTNDMNSNTAKMKKAKKLGIEIKLY